MKILWSSLLASSGLLLLLSVFPTIHCETVPYPPNLADETPLTVTADSYQAPKDSDSRSPCPFLNTAANHGLLPRDGKNIPLEWIARLVIKAGFDSKSAGLRIDATKKLIKVIKASTDPKHPDDKIDLSDYGLHGQIEHDQSLVRWNTLVPQQPHDGRPNADLIDKLLQMARPDQSSSVPVLTYADIVKWRLMRLKKEQERYAAALANKDNTVRKPEWDFHTKLLASSECNNILNILGRDGKISVDDARSFLVQERFPAGWTGTKNNFISLNEGLLYCYAVLKQPESVVDNMRDTSAGIFSAWFHRVENLVGAGLGYFKKLFSVQKAGETDHDYVRRMKATIRHSMGE